MKLAANRVPHFLFIFLLVCSASASAQRSNKSQTMVGTITGLRTNGIGPRTARHLGEQPTLDFKVGVVVEANGAKYNLHVLTEQFHQNRRQEDRRA